MLFDRALNSAEIGELLGVPEPGSAVLWAIAVFGVLGWHGRVRLCRCLRLA
ncbi:MAG: hypothetical protein JW888_05495 [Pirellulales bacterium]|nr:hypothetical protein [Pirellulales bacterium]